MGMLGALAGLFEHYSAVRIIARMPARIALSSLGHPISYKSKKITTQLPVIDIAIPEEGGMLDFMQSEVEVLLEAHDKNGSVVGQAKPEDDYAF